MKEEEQAGKKGSEKQVFEIDHNDDTSDSQFLKHTGNKVEVDESLFQEMDDLGLNGEVIHLQPANLSGEWTLLSAELDCHSVCGYTVLTGC